MTPFQVNHSGLHVESFPARKYLHRGRVADAVTRALEAGIGWLAAPAGYGKTTAIIDYLDRNGLSAFWVNIEASDSDPAQLIRHLSECLTDERRAMPNVPATDLAQGSESLVSFFHAYFAQLPGRVVVLDNLHRVATSELAVVITTMLRALPQDVRCICIARSGPDRSVDDLVAAGRMHIVDDQVLRFTPREARLLIVQRLRMAAAMIDVSTAQGQAAGLVMLARQLATSAALTLGDADIGAGPFERPQRADEPSVLQIGVLGSFRIEVDGQTLELGAKAPAKSLDILCALAISPGKSCALEDLYEWFWPDADGDQAKAACDQALHRLRKLLGDAARITQRNGRVQLGEHNLSVDLDRWEKSLREALRPSNDKEEVERAMERAFRSFPGPLVQCDRLTLWMQGPAERVRGKFIELTTRLARAYELRGAQARARAVYLRAIDMYPACSRCYESLIRNRLAQHDIACALEDYRRYERMLRASGAQPALAIQAAIKQAMSAQLIPRDTRQSFALA